MPVENHPIETDYKQNPARIDRESLSVFGESERCQVRLGLIRSEIEDGGSVQKRYLASAMFKELAFTHLREDERISGMLLSPEESCHLSATVFKRPVNVNKGHWTVDKFGDEYIPIFDGMNVSVSDGIARVKSLFKYTLDTEVRGRKVFVGAARNLTGRISEPQRLFTSTTFPDGEVAHKAQAGERVRCYYVTPSSEKYRCHSTREITNLPIPVTSLDFGKWVNDMVDVHFPNTSSDNVLRP